MRVQAALHGLFARRQAVRQEASVALRDALYAAEGLHIPVGEPQSSEWIGARNKQSSEHK